MIICALYFKKIEYIKRLTNNLERILLTTVDIAVGHGDDRQAEDNEQSGLHLDTGLWLLLRRTEGY